MRESFQLDGGDQIVSSEQLQAVETIRHLFPETWQMNQLTVVRYKSSLENNLFQYSIYSSCLFNPVDLLPCLPSHLDYELGTKMDHDLRNNVLLFHKLQFFT